MWPLELNTMNKSLWNDRCDYVDLDHCDNFNINQNLITLQLNIRSLLSHQSELKELLHKLDQKNSSAYIILLCETFLTDRTQKLVKIPGYNLITSNQKIPKGRNSNPAKQEHQLHMKNQPGKVSRM